MAFGHFYIHQRIYQNLLCSTKSTLCKRVNDCLGCRSLIILVSFDAAANLAYSYGAALLQIAVNSAFDLMRPQSLQ